MNNTLTEKKDSKAPTLLPIRCSVCGETFLTLYANTQPGIVFATCRTGHKTSYRVDDPSRKAV